MDNILVYNKNIGCGLDVDMINGRIIIDEITSEDL